MREKQSVKELEPYVVNPVVCSIKLDANEGNKDLYKDLIKKISSDFYLNTYPDDNYTELKKAIASYVKCDVKNISVGNGSSELLDLCVKAFVDTNELILSLDPTFSMYSLYAQIANSRYIGTGESNDFTIKVDDIIKSIKENNPKLTIICNPNNPTGKLIDPDLMLDIITYCRMNQIYVVIDECFMDFVKDCQKHTRKGLIPYNPYVVILNALTKLFAFPGIRIGYAMTSDADLIHAVNAQLPSWNVSAVAQLAGKEVVHHEEYVEESRKYVFREREYMYEEMKKLGLKVYEPSANFIFFKSDIPMYKKLLERHILIRNCDNFDGIMHGYCRVAIKKHNENEILLKEMENIINKNMAVT